MEKAKKAFSISDLSAPGAQMEVTLKTLNQKNPKKGSSYEPIYFEQLTLYEKTMSILLLFVAAIVPIIVQYKVVNLNADERSVFLRSESLELFSYYKSVVLIACAALFVLLFLIHYFTAKKPVKLLETLKRPVFIATLTYGFFVFLSTILSKYPSTALWGVFDRREGIFAIVSYLILFSVAATFIDSKLKVRILLYGLFVSATIIGLIGLSQTLQKDFFVSDLGLRLIMGKNYVPNGLSGVFTKAYGTLFNPNNAGLYSVLVFPIVFMLAILAPKGFIKYFSIFLSALSFLLLIGSGSAAGLVGFGVSLLVGFIALLIHFKNDSKIKNFKPYILGVSGFLLLVLLLFLLVPPLRNSVLTLKDKLLAQNTEFFVTDVTVGDNRVDIETRSGTLSVTKDNQNIQVLDFNGDVVNLTQTEKIDDTNFSFGAEVPNLGAIRIQVSNSIFALSFQNVYFIFNNNNAGLALLNKAGKIMKLDSVPSVGFKGRETFASSRGYIWSRSIPLIKNNIFIGGGPDSFIYYFPQEDIRGKLAGYGDPNMIVDKPHSIYLQAILNTGFLSFLAMVFVFVYALFVGWKALITPTTTETLQSESASEKSFLPVFKKDPLIDAVRIGLLAGISGYSVSASAVDSSVSVSPVFWICLGLLIAISSTKKEAL